MQAPLGRAVIGGLLCSTLCTLLVLPAVFSLILGNRKPKTVSIDPDDPESPYFDNFAETIQPGHVTNLPLNSLPATEGSI